MGNTGLNRRNSVFFSNKQDSSTSDKSDKHMISSRQSTLHEDEELLTGAKKAPPPEPLTERQKQLLCETWTILEKDIASVGVITFISLFETHPDVQQVFMPFRGIELEELTQSKQLRAHALRVMAFVQKAIARLQDAEKLDGLIRDLGKKHYGYGAKRSYVDLIGPQFVQAIQPSLEQQWNSEVEEAWNALFRQISYIMKEALTLEEQHQKK